MDKDMCEIKIKVEGMACEHCTQRVKNALEKLSGVEAVEVCLENKIVTVKYDDNQVTQEDMKSAIEEQGYDVV